MKQNYQTHAHFKLAKKLTFKTLLLLLIALIHPGSIICQQTYTFTSAGLTGQTGPSLTQINTTYTNTNLQGSVTVSGGIQSFTIPATGPYKITAIGAQGGYGGGYPARASGNFTLTAGTVLKILVGQAGQMALSGSNYAGGGGGGGSFITDNANIPYVVAGGGGGNGDGYVGPGLTCCLNGMEASITTTGNASPTTGGSPGGTAGGGGGGSCSGTYVAGGGAGIYGDGMVCLSGVAASSYTNNGTGGTGGGTPASGNGGFGGGGGGYNSGQGNRGGGGGGYSGGGSGYAASGNETAASGGGGGSFVSSSASSPSLAVSSTTGSGLVIIEQLCNVNLSTQGLGANNAMCSGNSVTLSTNAVSNYTWSNGATTQSIVVSPTSSGIYTFAGTSTAGCTAFGSISITVNGSVPSLSIVNTASATTGICIGKSATLTASGALAYSWSGGATTVTNGVGFFPATTTIYTVTGTNGCGQSTATTTITIAPLVVTASSSSSLVCQGSTVVLTAASAVNGYTWTPIGSSSNPITLAPQANTIYTVTASDGTCVGTATVAVNTNPIPVINVVASNSNVCDGSVVTLTASGASTFTWSGLSSNSAVVSVTPIGSTNYQVSGSNAFGCSSNGSQIVLTLPAPVLTLTATKMLVCVGGSVNITANGASTYAWVNGPAAAANLVNPTSPTTYSVVGTGTNGCPSQEYMITINTLSTNLSVSAATTAICEGGSTTLTATGANTYTWTGIPSSQGVAMVSPATTTVYTVTASTTVTGLSCPSTTNISITVNSNPTITVIASKTVVCRSDANITLTAGGGVTYSWSANTNSASATNSNVSVHPTTLNNNIYSVTGMNANGCVNSGSVTINVKACTGIGELSGIANTVMVYPNPSHGEFNVSTDSETSLKVINELGQEVRTIALTKENNFKGSVTNLAEGVYFLVGQNANGKINQKVIVTK